MGFELAPKFRFPRFVIKCRKITDPRKGHQTVCEWGLVASVRIAGSPFGFEGGEWGALFCSF